MTDNDQIKQRLRELQEEFKKGQEVLADLQQQEAELQQKLLRISGAIQVLEELLNGPEPESAAGASPGE